MSVWETLFAGAAGAVLYGGLELAWRGRTHWTMLIAGGFCFTAIYYIATRSDWQLWQQWLAGAMIITAVEFTTGCIVNIALGWEVWDYSALPLNLYGQICLLYSVLWFLLSIPATALCGVIKRLLF